MTSPPPAPTQPSKKRWLLVALLILAALVIGLQISVWLVPQPAVGIIRLQGDIWAASAEYLKLQIEEVRNTPGVKAVVLEIDSPGGEVTPTQDIYLEIQKLRAEIPVVVSINSMAASGGYYLAVSGEAIFAKPSSTIGNVGVWGFIPDDIGVNETVLASGPFKLTASNQAEFLREIEGIKQEFLSTVAASRGDRLNISTTELSQGLAYPGREALRLGLIDHLGSRSDAIEAAAEMASIVNYAIVDIEARVYQQLLETYSTTDWIGAADPATGQRPQLPPGIYLLYDENLIGGTP